MACASWNRYPGGGSAPEYGEFRFFQVAFIHGSTIILKILLMRNGDMQGRSGGEPADSLEGILAVWEDFKRYGGTPWQKMKALR